MSETDVVKKDNFLVCNQSGVGINYSVNNNKSYLWDKKCESWRIQGKASLSLEQTTHQADHLKSTYTISEGKYAFTSTTQNQGTDKEAKTIILKPLKPLK